jgi:hypothetical protein
MPGTSGFVLGIAFISRVVTEVIQPSFFLPYLWSWRSTYFLIIGIRYKKKSDFVPFWDKWNFGHKKFLRTPDVS